MRPLMKSHAVWVFTGFRWSGSIEGCLDQCSLELHTPPRSIRRSSSGQSHFKWDTSVLLMSFHPNLAFVAGGALANTARNELFSKQKSDNFSIIGQDTINESSRTGKSECRPPLAAAPRSHSSQQCLCSEFQIAANYPQTCFLFHRKPIYFWRENWNYFSIETIRLAEKPSHQNTLCIYKMWRRRK